MSYKFKSLLLLFVMFIFPKVIFASGSLSVSTTDISLTVGDSTTFVITASNAAGRVDISLSDSSAVKAVIKDSDFSDTSDFLDNSSTTVTVTALKVGTSKINVVASDMTSYDKEDITTSYTINVNVKEKVKEEKIEEEKKKEEKKIDNTSDDKKYSNNTTKSSNTKLKSLEIEGYKVIEKDDGTYELKVKSSVSKIKINVILDDTKAKVTGDGEKKLSEGKNTFDIVVTAEDGTSKTYKLVVKREKSEYYLEDVDDFVDSDSDTLLLKDNDSLTNDMISKLEVLNRNIELVKRNGSNTLYSFSLNTNDLKNTFNTDVISSLDSDGLSLNLDKNIPIGTKLKFNVKGKFDNNQKVDIYKYDNLELVFIDSVYVSNNSILFTLNGESKYLLKGTFLESDISDDSGISNYLIVGGVATVVIIGGGTVFLLKKKKI